MRPVSRVCFTGRLLFYLRCLLHPKKGYHSQKGKAARWAEAQNVAHIEEACVRTTRPRPWRKTACDTKRNWDAAQLLVSFHVKRICSSSLRIVPLILLFTYSVFASLAVRCVLGAMVPAQLGNSE